MGSREPPPPQTPHGRRGGAAVGLTAWCVWGGGPMGGGPMGGVPPSSVSDHLGFPPPQPPNPLVPLSHGGKRSPPRSARCPEGPPPNPPPPSPPHLPAPPHIPPPSLSLQRRSSSCSPRNPARPPRSPALRSGCAAPREPGGRLRISQERRGPPRPGPPPRA